MLAEKIVYKNTIYDCNTNSCVLIHDDAGKTSFDFGIITKIIVEKETPTKTSVNILYQFTESTYVKELSVYKILPTAGKFGIVNIEDLATFHPMQLHNVKHSPEPFIVSLRNKPILFSK